MRSHPTEMCVGNLILPYVFQKSSTVFTSAILLIRSSQFFDWLFKQYQVHDRDSGNSLASKFAVSDWSDSVGWGVTTGDGDSSPENDNSSESVENPESHEAEKIKLEKLASDWLIDQKSTRVQHYITILNLQKRLKDLHLVLKLGTFRTSEYYRIF